MVAVRRMSTTPQFPAIYWAPPWWKWLGVALGPICPATAAKPAAGRSTPRRKPPLAHLRMKEKWATQARALTDGITTAKAAKRCDVGTKTAFRWRHKFLKSLAGDKPAALSGIVESDETFILESFKGRRSDLPGKPRKRGGKSDKRNLSAEQIPMIVARDRHGATTDAVLPKLNRVSIVAALGGVVTPTNAFCCDGGSAIVTFARKAGIPTNILPPQGKPNPRAPDPGGAGR